MNDVAWAPGERRRIATLGVLVLGAMLAPVLRNLRPPKQQADSFPLSHYPMFRQLRKRNVTIVHAVGTDIHGERHYLPTKVLVEDAINTTRHQLNRAVRGGRATEYATALAEKVAAAPALWHIVRVDIVKGRFNLDDCLLGGPGQVRPTDIIEVATAPVADRPQPPPPPVDDPVEESQALDVSNIEDVSNADVKAEIDSGSNGEVSA